MSVQAIIRASRRIVKAIGRGRIGMRDDTGNVQKVQVSFSAFETNDNLPRLAEFGFSSSPPDQSDAIVLFISGDRSNGVVIATGHQQSRFKNLQPGESVLYNQNGACVYLSNDGIIVDAKGGNVTVNNVDVATINCTTLQLNGNLSVAGTVTATGEGKFNGNHTVSAHTHGGVQSGSATTAAPTG